MSVINSDAMVLEALQAACSQDTNILKPAEMTLKEWEIQPGFYSILLKIFANQTINFNIRWLAALYFKNGVDKYWRKNAPNGIVEAEKISLRNELINSFNEPIQQIAVQIAVIVSKIARYDCPREWPELMPALMQAIKDPESLHQHRALLSTHHVVKSLSSKRLTGDRRLFQELTENIFPFILNISNERTEMFLNLVNNDGSKDLMVDNLEKALLTLRILRKLVIFGIKKPHESQLCLVFMKNLFLKAKMMLESRQYLRDKGANLLELCEKYIIHLTKILLDVLQHHPFSFVDLIQPALEFCVFYVFTPDGICQLYERFTIQCLNIIKGIVMCIEYKPPKGIDQTNNTETIHAADIKERFFTPSTLAEICKKLVTHYFILLPDDLALWDNDPESFAIDEIGESWKYNLRPCTETLFVALIHEYKKEMGPILVELIQDSHGIVSSEDLASILKKDAVYNAVGLSAFFLYEEIDFDNWFSNILTIEIQNKENNYRILRRAAIKLIGHWTTVKLSVDKRPALYSLIASLLSPSEDLAVRLAASNTLRLAVDDFEFQTLQFLPFLETIFGLLFQLLKEANECDTKMHVLYVLSFIIERVGLSIRPFADSLVQYLPMLWDESAHHNMLRCAIVSTLVRIIKAFTIVPDSLYGFVLPVISLSTDVTQDSHVYLMEDGLDLWLAVLENSLAMTPGILELCRNLQSIIESSSETLRISLCIIQANIVMAPEIFLQCYGESTMNTFVSLINDLRVEGVILIMRVLEISIRAAHQNGINYIKPLLPYIIEKLYQNDSFPQAMSLYLSIISRVLLLQPEALSEVLAAINRNSMDVGSNHTALARILDVWLERMVHVTQPEKRKLLSLALCSLLTAQSEIILDRLCGIFLNVSETLNDIMKEDEDGAITDSLIITPNSSPVIYDDGEYETEHDRRRKKLVHFDSVHTVVLRDYFQSQLNALRAQVGDATFQSLLQTVDCETIAMTKEHVSI